MAITSTVTVNQYIGNGSTVSYPYTFYAFSYTDLVVSTFELGVETVLVRDTDYTVDEDSASITLTGDAPSSDVTIQIKRVLPITQLIDIKNGGSFLPSAIETALDRLAMVDQQQQTELDKCIMLSPVEDGSFDPTLPAGMADNPGALIVVNDAGDGFEIGPNAADVENAAAGADAAEAFAASCEAYASDAIDAASDAGVYAASALASSDATLAYYSKIAFVVSDTVSSDGAVSDGAQFVPCDPSSSSISLSLPYSSDNPDTRIIFKNITSSTNQVVILGSGGDTIDGASSTTISSAYGYVAVVGDGDSSWWIVQ